MAEPVQVVELDLTATLEAMLQHQAADDGDHLPPF